MNSRLKALVVRALPFGPVGWFVDEVMGNVSRAYGKLIWLRYSSDHPAIMRKVTARYFPDLKVLHGPFQGMQYASIASHGSSLFPKLFGTYEDEVHPWVETFCGKNYDTVLNVGCGEGYYAIGFALRMPKTTVLAFDISTRAQAMCKQMAELNGVSDRVQVFGECTPDGLVTSTKGKRALILIDCEGFEKELLTEKNAPLLARHDFLIETHDFIQPGVTKYLIDLFSQTHDAHQVQNLNEYAKADMRRIPELKRRSIDERRIILAEHRGGQGQWLILTARQT